MASNAGCATRSSGSWQTRLEGDRAQGLRRGQGTVDMRATIIGAGRMGRRHIQAVRAAGLELAGIADTSRDALAQAKADGNLSEQSLYDSAPKMLHETKPECVVIATTAPSHCEYTQHALQAGA